MGASHNEQLSLTSCITARDRREEKSFYDNVHGNIYIDPLSLKFVDTEQFQRLRDLKQLGLAHMVYPGAVHTRFEHSLGVYWLAGEAVQKLQAYQGELGIDRVDIRTVKLAGLLHDIGHGPFSHLFERGFLPRVLKGSEWNHEDMSVKLVDYMVDEHNIDIDPGILKRAKEMILASSEIVSPKSTGEKRFLYDVVANGRNGIDVDKFDYIGRDCRACGLGCNFQFQRLMDTMRVIDDEICYRAKEYLTIHKMFATRADLYRTVYTHAKVKAIELMFVDALVKANSYLHISSKISDPSEYWKLDDTILKTIETKKELKESSDLIRRIRRRDLYQFCNEYAVPKDKLEHFKNITAGDIVCSQKASGITLKEEDVAVCNVKIDLTRGSCNPLESIKFFKDYESVDKFSITDTSISHLLPSSYQDTIVRVYAKKPELVEAISDAFENFQLKTYGIKAQVHGTPEKKKRRRFGRREEKKMKESGDGFVRADKIDLKSLDEQLERHLNRVVSMDRKRGTVEESTPQGHEVINKQRVVHREDWEIDPTKLIIKTVIGRGTFGTVHRGVYDALDVAVKLLDWGEEGHRTEAEIASLRTAFTQEVAVWHKLDHPNVTKFIGSTMGSSDLKIQTENGRVGMPSNFCCVVVEYLPGGALKSYLIKNRRRKLAFKVVVQLALDLARGLSYLHSEKIVHRDVKTENMLLDKTRTLKIADFGVARVEAQNPNDMTGETGTLGYMAPEVLNGNPYNRKCDVYSFGICLWEIYCCDMPYPDLSFSEVTSAVVQQNLRPEIPRCCPSSIANVMKRCWDANPDKRPDMDEVVSMIEAIDTSKGGGMIPVDQSQGCLWFRKKRGP